MGKFLAILLIILIVAIFLGCFIYMLVSASEGVVLMWIIFILFVLIGGSR